MVVQPQLKNKSYGMYIIVINGLNASCYAQKVLNFIEKFLVVRFFISYCDSIKQDKK